MNGALKKLSIISGAVLLSGALAIAQQNPPPMPQRNEPSNNPATMQNQQMQAQEQQNQAESSMRDKAFLRKAAEGGMAEVELGQLAQQKASSQDVRQFGEKMAQDHSQLNEQLKPIAEQEGVRPPKGLSKKDEATMKKLEGLSGTEFDHAYIEAMLKDHKKDLKEFRETADRTQNPQLKDAAQRGAQVIESHLQEIQQIARTHNVNAKGA